MRYDILNIFNVIINYVNKLFNFKSLKLYKIIKTINNLAYKF